MGRAELACGTSISAKWTKGAGGASRGKKGRAAGPWAAALEFVDTEGAEVLQKAPKCLLPRQGVKREKDKTYNQFPGFQILSQLICNQLDTRLIRIYVCKVWQHRPTRERSPAFPGGLRHPGGLQTGHAGHRRADGPGGGSAPG